MPAKHIIHTVGPVWRGGDRGEPALLASAYRSSLTLAEKHGIRSIAFPAISCGIYGYPVSEAAPLAVRTVREHLAGGSGLAEVIFVCFDETVFAAYEAALSR